MRSPSVRLGLESALFVVAVSLLGVSAHAGPVAFRAAAKTPEALAQRLWRLAEENQLDDALAAKAAELLGHEDPFVRAMAEWAISLKVGAENNRQDIVWPNPHPPEWYRVWSGISPEAYVELDWSRQALSAGLDRSSEKLLASVDAMIGRSERMAADFGRDGDSIDALCAIRRRLAQRIEMARDDRAAHRRLWMDSRRIMRDLALSNPAIDFDRVAFVKHFAPHTTRNITRTFSWQRKPGGDLCVLSGLDSPGQVTGVLQGQLGPGHVRRFDLWWNGDRVVFAFARQPNWPPEVDTTHYAAEGGSAWKLRQVHQPLRLYEIDLDGTELKPLTGDSFYNDFEPAYLANGDVVFASDRCDRAAECGPFEYDIPNCNLYVVSREDGRVHHLTDSKDIDRHPYCLNSGQIAYTHWEYQERHFMEVHSLWSVRPDGTMSRALFKHHMKSPLGLRSVRSIPGSDRLLAIATGHHTFAHGPVVVVDPRKGPNSESGLRIVTPGVVPQEGSMAGRPVPQGGVADRGGLYQTPWAVSEKCFLVSYAYARENCTAPLGVDSNAFAVYLIDVYGNKELLHRDPIFSCADPAPVRPRPRPPMVTTVAARSGDDATTRENTATCYVTNVYEGMPEVPRGTVKYIRIAQHVGWPLDAERGMMPYMPGKAFRKTFGYWSWSPVRVIGEVPVEADGSACFQVPADKAIYFQILDERHMEIRRMRSMASFKPGETHGCRGCHELQAKAPATGSHSLAALQRPPRRPTPPPWGADKMLGYEWLVQPILDRHCTRCHDADEPDGNLDLTATPAAGGFYQSFHTLFGARKGQEKLAPPLVVCSDRFSNSEVTRPKQFGSHASPLIQTLLTDKLHKQEVKLSKQEWYALVTWIDANAPYEDKFINKRPKDGGPPQRNIMATTLRAP